MERSNDAVHYVLEGDALSFLSKAWGSACPEHVVLLTQEAVQSHPIDTFCCTAGHCCQAYSAAPDVQRLHYILHQQGFACEKQGCHFQKSKPTSPGHMQARLIPSDKSESTHQCLLGQLSGRCDLQGCRVLHALGIRPRQSPSDCRSPHK